MSQMSPLLVWITAPRGSSTALARGGRGWEGWEGCEGSPAGGLVLARRWAVGTPLQDCTAGLPLVGPPAALPFPQAPRSRAAGPAPPAPPASSAAAAASPTGRSLNTSLQAHAGPSAGEHAGNKVAGSSCVQLRQHAGCTSLPHNPSQPAPSGGSILRLCRLALQGQAGSRGRGLSRGVRRAIHSRVRMSKGESLAWQRHRMA